MIAEKWGISREALDAFGAEIGPSGRGGHR